MPARLKETNQFDDERTITGEYYPVLEHFRLACSENLFVSTTIQQQKRMSAKIY